METYPERYAELKERSMGLVSLDLDYWKEKFAELKQLQLEEQS